MDIPVWIPAIKRLMAAKGYDSQAAFIRAARKRGVALRPNTFSAALSGGPDELNMRTIKAIARVLEVPLSALFLTAEEAAALDYAQRLSAEHHLHREEQLKADILAKLAPVVEAALKAQRESEAPPAVPQIVQRRGRRPA